MTCSEAAKLLYEYMDKELGPDDVKRLEEHLRDCEKCMGHLEFDQALRKLLKKKASQIKLPPEMEAKIIDQLRAETKE